MRCAGRHLHCTAGHLSFCRPPSDVSSTASYPPWFHAIELAHAPKISGALTSFGSKLLTGVATHDSSLYPSPHTVSWALLRSRTARSISTKKLSSKTTRGAPAALLA